MYQIVYDESQLQECYPFANIIFSKDSHELNTGHKWVTGEKCTGLTDYFENAHIASIVPEENEDYIAVCSWRLRRKRADAAYYLGGFGKDALTLEKIQRAIPFDVAILTPHGPTHRPLAMASNWHGKAWDDAFEAFKPFLRQFGPVPEELTHSIYENHFFAKREIYHDYVNTWLLPAIDFIGDNPVFFTDSGYVQKKRDAKEIERVQKLLGRNDWPITPFLLERLFSFYIEKKTINVIKL